jgi:hypothetical protein
MKLAATMRTQLIAPKTEVRSIVRMIVKKEYRRSKSQYSFRVGVSEAQTANRKISRARGADLNSNQER